MRAEGEVKGSDPAKALDVSARVQRNVPSLCLLLEFPLTAEKRSSARISLTADHARGSHCSLKSCTACRSHSLQQADRALSLPARHSLARPRPADLHGDVYQDEACDAGLSGGGGEGGGAVHGDGDDDDDQVQRGDDGVFWAEVEVPAVCVGKLIGKRGAAKQQLEAETGAKCVPTAAAA
jgi:hypothetical protein